GEAAMRLSMRRGERRDTETRRRVDAGSGRRVDAAIKPDGFSLFRRVYASTRLRVRYSRARGFTLIELVMTLSILTILTLGVIPLVKLSVKRQREERLRETLREMRAAIDQFHRDTIGMQCAGAGGALPQAGPTPTQEGQPTQRQPQPQPYLDPRS